MNGLPPNNEALALEQLILGCFRAGIVAIGTDGKVTYLNAIGRKILAGTGLKEEECVHTRAGENAFFRVLSESLTMNYLPTRLEVDLSGKDGEHQFIGFTLAELRDGDAKVGICAFFKDLTQVEMAEENENLKQRLVLLGQMAAGLAHEIRNPIASIGVHCGILKNRLREDEKLQSSVGMISREVAKVEYIIRECLNFVRPADLGLTTVNIGDVLRRVVDRARSVFPGMAYRLKLPSESEVTAEADKILLEQAIFNIVSNAAEACEGKGKVDVSVGVSRHFSDLLRVNRQVEAFLPTQSVTEKEFVRITIRDDGPGIPEELQEKIFVPFFTTKKTGTGIGLPMAQKIIHSHGGILDLKSGAGKGAEFIIKIPVRP